MRTRSLRLVVGAALACASRSDSIRQARRPPPRARSPRPAGRRGSSPARTALHRRRRSWRHVLRPARLRLRPREAVRRHDDERRRQVEFVGETGTVDARHRRPPTGDGTGAWEFDVAPTAAWTPGQVTVRARGRRRARATARRVLLPAARRQCRGGHARRRLPARRLDPVTGHRLRAGHGRASTRSQEERAAARYSPARRHAPTAGPRPVRPVHGRQGRRRHVQGDAAAERDGRPDGRRRTRATRRPSGDRGRQRDLHRPRHGRLGSRRARRRRRHALACRRPRWSLENTFVSAVGWVKPGETYPFRVFVKNYDGEPGRAARRSRSRRPDGTTFTARRRRRPARARPRSPAARSPGTSASVPAAHRRRPGDRGRSSSRRRRDTLAAGPADRLEEPLLDGDADLHGRRRRDVDAATARR